MLCMLGRQPWPVASSGGLRGRVGEGCLPTACTSSRSGLKSNSWRTRVPPWKPQGGGGKSRGAYSTVALRSCGCQGRGQQRRERPKRQNASRWRGPNGRRGCRHPELPRWRGPNGRRGCCHAELPQAPGIRPKQIVVVSSNIEQLSSPSPLELLR
eukprot:8736712-Alexandrium_andersonii.AAC.1